MDRSTLLEPRRPVAAPAGVPAVRLACAASPAQVGLSEAAVVVALVALATAVRWPDFLYLPLFTDEAYDATRSALIAQGRLQTLVNSSPYIGSLQNYLTAGLLSLFGPQIYLPRLLLLIAGCLTVAAAYLLGREWGGPLAGTLAAALLAANPVHVLVNSHIAWSNCLTPLFTTLGLWQLTRAGRWSDGPALAWSGALLGAAMLTHPAAVILLPACAVYLVWKAPRLVRSRWLWISAGLFVLVYSPVVLYELFARFYPAEFAEQLRGSHPDTRAFGSSLGTDFDPLQYAAQVRESHAGRDFGPDMYAENLPGFTLLFLRSLPGAIDVRPGPADYLLDPALLLWLGLGVAALVVLARGGNTLPLLVVISSLAVAPFWSVKRFEPISHGRYFMPIVVALYAAVAAVAVGLVAQLGRTARLRLALAGLLGVAGLALALQLLVQLVRYYDSRPADNRSSIEALGAIEAAREPGEVVLIDRRLSDRRLGEGAVSLDQTLVMLLTIRAVPFAIADLESDDVQAALAGRAGQLAVLDRASVPRLSDRYTLTQLAAIAPRLGRGDRQRDPIASWRDSPIAALLRELDPQAAPERRDVRTCADCADHAVYRMARK